MGLRGNIKVRALQRARDREKPDFTDPKVHKACLKKVIYPSKRIARDAAKRLMKLFGTPYKAYHCRYFSGHYHLTSRVLTVFVEPEREVAIEHPSAPKRLLQNLADTKVRRLVRAEPAKELHR